MKMLTKKPIILLLDIYLINYLSFFNSATKLKIKVDQNLCHRKVNHIMKNLTELFGSGLFLHIAVSDDSSACLSTDLMKEISKS